MVRCHLTPNSMNKASLLNELQSKIGQLMQQSPAADLEKNLKALMSQGFAKLDLLTREEFDVQTEVLARTRAKLEQLEARVAELEAQKKS
jgi:ubiquinone biosynthesis accessory factor UbiK